MKTLKRNLPAVVKSKSVGQRNIRFDIEMNAREAYDFQVFLKMSLMSADKMEKLCPTIRGSLECFVTALDKFMDTNEI